MLYKGCSEYAGQPFIFVIMGIILSIEASTKIGSVAVHDRGKLLAEVCVRGAFSHSRKLATMVQEVLKLADLEMSSVKAIAVSAGPGSYTGLRIGGSLAKGLCFSLDVPLIAISTLDFMAMAIAKGTGDRAGFYAPMIDARRIEVYTTVYDYAGALLLPVQPMILSDGVFAEWLEQGNFYYAGDGAEKAQDFLNHGNALYVPDFEPMASQMGAMAFERFQKGQFENLADWQPVYLKDGVQVGGKV
jgi:tRNA threonylcarbamoyladenosine biosynthesis protein TsaB